MFNILLFVSFRFVLLFCFVLFCFVFFKLLSISNLGHSFDKPYQFSRYANLVWI